MADLSEEVMAELNGAIYLHNEAGEPQLDVNTYLVIIAADFPGADEDDLFCEDPIRGEGEAIDKISFTNGETQAFFADNAAFIRLICKVGENQLSNNALCDLIMLKYLCYRHRLCCPNLNNAEFYVMYNDAKVYDPRNNQSVIGKLRADAAYDTMKNMCITYFNQNRNLVKCLTNQFTNLICTVAYVFRQLGHHYKSGGTYEDTYKRIWRKVTGTETVEGASATWEQMSTIGVHSVMPCVLDAYWAYSRDTGKCAAPLNLRFTVPAAGTAAPFALYVGWNDARSIYGAVLHDNDEIYERLEALVKYLKTHRWAHGINAQYYNATTERIDMSPYQSMAATVEGVYEACAAEATLLKSKSMSREASGAPLQKDISRMSAKALRSVYIRQISKSFQHELPGSSK